MLAKAVTAADLGIPEGIPLPQRSDWRIGLIGFGSIAGAHVPAYAAAGWQVVAVADLDPAARERAAQQLPGARIYEDFAQLVDDPEAEVVSLLTHPTFREPAVRAAAEAGKPIQTEKPLGPDMATCERTVAIAEHAGIPFSVSQNYRWSGANFFAHHIVAAGLIGKPFYASIEIQDRQDVGLAGHPFYSTCDDFLTVQWNNHLADLQRYWLGADARRVFACTRRMAGQNFVSDNLLITVADFGDGVTGHVVHSELLRSPLRRAQCRVDGDEGSLVFDLHGTSLTIQSRQLGHDPYELDATGRPPLSSFCGPMADLLISVEKGREPLVSARRNLTTIRQVLAEKESVARGGEWVAP